MSKLKRVFTHKSKLFFIPLTMIIIIGILVWACKHPFGPGISGIDVINGGGGSGGSVPAKGWYMNESGGPGYKGNVEAYVSTNKIVPSRQKPHGGIVWQKQAGNYHYRIPTLMQLPDGDLLAFADRRIGSVGDLPNKIEIVMKISTDNGTNWSAEKLVSPQCVSEKESYGDGAFVIDRKTGNIICVVASGPGFLAPTTAQPYGSTPEQPTRIKVIKSGNNGNSWESPVDITDQIYGANCKNQERKTWHGLFTTSGNGVQLRNGRIMFVLNVRKSANNSPLYNYVMYSDDGGDTWNVSKEAPGISKNPNRGGSEAKIVELNDGTLLMAIRPESIYQRFFAKSTDNGETWSEMESKIELSSSASNGDIIYYTSTNNGWDKNIIITMFGSRPWTGQGTGPGNPKLYYSYDEGESWKGLQVFSGNAGYSSLAILKDGSIGILTELENSWSGPIYFMRANMKWLSEDTYTGPFKLEVGQ